RSADGVTSADSIEHILASNPSGLPSSATMARTSSQGGDHNRSTGGVTSTSDSATTTSWSCTCSTARYDTLLPNASRYSSAWSASGAVVTSEECTVWVGVARRRRWATVWPLMTWAL